MIKLLLVIFCLQTYSNMNHTRIKNGKVELINENGSLIRTIYSNNTAAVDADMSDDGKLIVITLENGSVDLRKDNGSDIRTMYMSSSNKATRARFDGENVIITLGNGKSQLTKQNGSPIRTF